MGATAAPLDYIDKFDENGNFKRGRDSLAVQGLVSVKFHVDRLGKNRGYHGRSSLDAVCRDGGARENDGFSPRRRTTLGRGST